MAFDTVFRTTQEYLNIKAGTVGLTKQECLQRLSGRTIVNNNVVDSQDCANTYASTSGPVETIQDALNNKVGYVQNALTTQEAVRRL